MVHSCREFFITKQQIYARNNSIGSTIWALLLQNNMSCFVLDIASWEQLPGGQLLPFLGITVTWQIVSLFVLHELIDIYEQASSHTSWLMASL
jgi:hypothetical protein